MLTRAVERYVELHRAGGFKFHEQNKVLKNFVAFATAAGDEVVRSDRVLEWVALRPSIRRRRILLLTVRRFALTLKSEDPRHEVPAANAFARVVVERRSPYIYTIDEIARLMRAAETPVLRSIAPVTYVALFGLLAATGLRISEAIALQCGDLSEDGLVIRNSKRRTSRLVPLHETTRRALDAYLVSSGRPRSCDGPLFVSVSGRALLYATVNKIFRRLIQSAGLRKGAGQRNPRIHDLRHTFAVRSLERCGHDRDAVARHIVALSTYLGHTSVTGTYWYLEATPGVLRQIADVSESMHRRGVP